MRTGILACMAITCLMFAGCETKKAINAGGLLEASIKGDSLVLESKGAMEEVNLTLNVHYEDATKTPVTRYWATWGAGEEKSVELPRSGHVQKIEATGKAICKGQRVSLDVDWSFKSRFFDIARDMSAQRDAQAVYLAYKGMSELRNVRCVTTVEYYRKKRDRVVKEETWETWQVGEKKTIATPEPKAVAKVLCKGSAVRDGTPVEWDFSGEFDCSTIDDFDVNKNEGVFSHDVHVKYSGDRTLRDCKVVLTVYFDRGQCPAFERYWSSWTPNETKTLNINNSGAIQRIELSGTAKKDDEDMKLWLDVSWRR